MRVRNEIHPRGSEGVRKSITEIIKAIEAGRIDPATIAWARETVKNAGFPEDKMVIAEAILTRLRNERGYIEDPVDTETIVSSACLLEGCHGLTFYGEDCDGLLIAFLAACEAVGVEGAVVNHGFDPGGLVMDHVLAAVYDRPKKRWIRCDPATKQPFGTVHTPTRERMYLVPGGKLLCDSKGFCNPQQLSRVGAVRENLRPRGGEFVGVGRPFDGMVGEGAEPVFGDVSEAFYQMMLDQLEEAAISVDQSFNILSRRRMEMEYVVSTLGEPLIQEPANNQTVWTDDLERQYQSLQYMVPLYLAYLQEAIAGIRKVVWDEARQTILITGVPGDVAFIEQNGKLITFDTTEAATGKLQPIGQVGQVVEIGLIVIGLGIIAVCSYVQYKFIDRVVDAISEIAETVKFNKALEWGDKRIAQGEDPDKVRKDMREMLADSREATESKMREEEKPFGEITSLAKQGLTAFLVVGGIGAVAYGLSAVVPLLTKGNRRY